jgi:hypothetical protein
MPDKPDPKKLEALLAGIMTKMPEQPDPSESLDQDQERVIEADKILLRDGSGKCRGKISANENGSAGLILSDNKGTAWAWLGINRDGEAFLELKDKKGEIKFKVPVETPSPGVAAEIPDAVSGGVAQDPASQSHGYQGAPQQPAIPAAEVSTPRSRPGVGQSPFTVPPDWKPGFVDTSLYDRLEELERKDRGRGFFRTALLGLLAVILATQTFLLMRPQSPKGPLEVENLMVRDQNGNLRAWLGEKDGKLALNLRDQQGRLRAALGLGSDGSPAFVLYDEGQRVRAQLQLSPDGAPRFDLRDNNSLIGKIEQHTTNDPDNQQRLAVSDPGDEDGTMASPVGSATEAVSPGREVAAEPIYVGSKTSNKYHYPTCKWARTIKPARLIKFKSVEEAQERHYIPCPVCKPPPLSK